MRRAFAEEAISLARATDDARTLAEVLGNVLEPIRVPDTLAWRIGLAEELVGCADEVGDPALRFSAHNMDFHTCVERGDLERAKLALEQLQLIAHELDQPTLKWFATFSTAGVKLMCGDLVAGERLFESALQIGQEAGQPDAVLAYAAALQQARIYQGRSGEIIAMMEQSVSAYRPSQPGEPDWQPPCAISIEEPRPRRSSSRPPVTASSTSRRTRPR
jgi:hypothetical protein